MPPPPELGTSDGARTLDPKGYFAVWDTNLSRGPTPRGAALASQAIAASEPVDAQFFDGEADVMTAALQRLVAARDLLTSKPT